MPVAACRRRRGTRTNTRCTRLRPAGKGSHRLVRGRGKSRASQPVAGAARAISWRVRTRIDRYDLFLSSRLTSDIDIRLVKLSVHHRRLRFEACWTTQRDFRNSPETLFKRPEIPN